MRIGCANILPTIQFVCPNGLWSAQPDLCNGYKLFNQVDFHSIAYKLLSSSEF